MTKFSKPITFHSLYEDGYSGSMTQLLQHEGWESIYHESADIIVFNGGADIGTEIYGEEPVYGGIPYLKSKRDRHEIEIWDKYKASPKLKLGICRGAQLLNCLNGGTLWQDVNNHGRTHAMTVLATGEKFRATSTHHQMMRPSKNAIIIATANEATRKTAQGATYPNGIRPFLDDHKDAEIVYYSDTHSLCIQGHPEYVPGSAFANYCIDLTKQYLKEVKQCVA